MSYYDPDLALALMMSRIDLNNQAAREVARREAVDREIYRQEAIREAARREALAREVARQEAVRREAALLAVRQQQALGGYGLYNAPYYASPYLAAPAPSYGVVDTKSNPHTKGTQAYYDWKSKAERQNADFYASAGMRDEAKKADIRGNYAAGRKAELKGTRRY